MEVVLEVVVFVTLIMVSIVPEVVDWCMVLVVFELDCEVVVPLSWWWWSVVAVDVVLAAIEVLVVEEVCSGSRRCGNGGRCHCRSLWCSSK